MKKKALEVLEYDKIIRNLTDQANSDMAKEIISEFRPFRDIRQIRDGLEETTEAVSLIIHKGPLPLGGFYDISDSVHFARKGGVLTMSQLLHVRYNLSIARQVISFLKSDVPPMPAIMSISELIVPAGRLEEDIERCIISEDEMSDNASTELRDIRRSIARQKDAIKARMDRIVYSSGNKPFLQDAIVTVRDGRYVVPVKQEYKSQMPGVIHDESSTGATVFIEPQVIVTMNNELRELEIAERAEMDRILGELSLAVSEHFHDLINNQKLMTQLDIIMAKEKLSVSYKGEEPEVTDDTSQRLVLKSARHPLIDPEKVVPIDVALGGDYLTLVITGPNTGGKTVTLKTLGLMVLMAQTGLHIPAESGSVIPVFEKVFADIGDEQSIEQSLSTFSSHMKNIVEIMDEADDSSMVLLDELGAGTDPTEGAALAISILEELFRRGARTAATTHYTELKKYAVGTEGVENASMEFSLETLSPTYRLAMGVPGRSNAFEISKKLGLPGSITDRARMLLDGGDIQFEEVISALEEDKRKAEEERDEAIMLNVAVKKEKAELDKKMRRFEEQRENMLNDAKAQARDIIKDAQSTAKEVQAELRELSRIESMGERNKRFDESRKRLRDKAGRYREKIIKEVNDNPVAPEDLKLGDRVKVLTLGQKGDIIGLPDDKGNLQVQVGSLKVNASIEDIMLIEGGAMGTNRQKKVSSSYGKMFKNKAKTVSIQIDVRGKNLDEALAETEKYLDDAFMAGLEEVTIIHGRGEGILRKGIQDMLRKNRQVKSFQKGDFHGGGDGVTVVKMNI